jgi:hypothetical protein
MVGIALDFATKLANVDVERALVAVKGWPPNVLEDECAFEGAAGVGDEEPQQGELAG